MSFQLQGCSLLRFYRPWHTGRRCCAPRLLGVLALQNLHEGWQQCNQGGVLATDRLTRRSERRAHADRGVGRDCSATQARDPIACPAVSVLEPGRVGILPPLPIPRWSGCSAWRYHVVARISAKVARFHPTQQFTHAGAKVSNGARAVCWENKPRARGVSPTPATNDCLWSQAAGHWHEASNFIHWL